MDDAVAKAIAVADQEVVAQPLIAPREVLVVNLAGCGGELAEMVDHDALPAGPVGLDGEGEDRIMLGTFTELADIGQREAGGRAPARLRR